MTGTTEKYLKRLSAGTCVLVLGLIVSGCSTFDGLSAPSLPSLPNPTKWFKGEEKKLPGERIAVMQAQDHIRSSATAATAPVILPGAILNPVWSQPGGVATNAPGHLSLSGSSLQVRWSADIGYGSSSKGKLTSSPIIVDGRIYTLDTRGRLSAFSTGSGSKLWSGSLTPENEKDYEGFGGGLAADGGRLFAATGYGTVSAVNPENGSILWTTKIGAPIRSSPTAAAGKVFVVSTEGEITCLAAVDGQRLWSYRGLPESAALLTNASPAVLGEMVVVPFPSGEIVAIDIASGKPVWAESLTRRRASSSLSSLTNPSRPVIYQNTVYAVGHAGKMLATSVEHGERVWNQNIAGVQTPWVAGNSVFVVDLNGKLMALDRRDGKVHWVSELEKAYSWNGPVLAGGVLWLVSSKGLIVGVNAVDGKVMTQKDLGTTVFISPVVANGKMYVLNDNGRLMAVN